MIPDLATLRDRAKNRAAKIIYGILAMGWRGSAVHWYRHETASLLLAGLATPLVVSVHTIVSFDFAFGIVPGWHSTIFPPYFVAGAIYSGFAMVLTLSIPVRKLFHLEDFITMRHLDNMGKVMLATGLIVAYGYMMEAFIAWYSGNQLRTLHDPEPHDRAVRGRLLVLIACNIVTPQFLWFRKVRAECGRAVRHRHGGQHRHVAGAIRDRRHQPASRLSCRRRGACTTPRAGTLPRSSARSDFSCSLLFLFIRFLPLISIFEMRTLVAAKTRKRRPSDDAVPKAFNSSAMAEVR